ncbi:MAG: hypothetical protein KDK33_05135, partial [Leptospiraceae bacterium]|nr:hypothetical protein [Leptospiraceae bacterium]
MDVKDIKQLYQAIGKIDPQSPPSILVSGTDDSIFDSVLEKVEARIASVGPEITSFGGEPGDGERFLEEIFNIPLFGSMRLLVFRHAEQYLAGILSKDSKRDAYQSNLGNRPDATLLLIQYSGAPSKGFIKSLGSDLIHYVSRDIYAEKLESTIEQLAHTMGLVLQEDALHELKERTPPRTGAIQNNLQRLKDQLASDKRKNISLADVRDVLFPRVGWNLFRLVDSLFIGDLMAYRSEIMSYNASTDSFLSLLSQI